MLLLRPLYSRLHFYERQLVNDKRNWSLKVFGGAVPDTRNPSRTLQGLHSSTFSYLN